MDKPKPINLPPAKPFFSTSDDWTLMLAPDITGEPSSLTFENIGGDPKKGKKFKLRSSKDFKLVPVTESKLNADGSTSYFTSFHEIHKDSVIKSPVKP